MPEAVSLPEDVWMYIAHFTTVKAIAALSDTCRTLRSCLTCKSVWSDVLHDLVVLSPNMYLQRNLDDIDAEQLKLYALQYVRVAEHTSSLDELVGTSIAKPEAVFVFEHPVIDVRLLPGLPFLIWISTEATVHLLDARTGEEADQWKSSISIVSAVRGEVEIWEARQYGCMVLIAMLIQTESATTVWAHWLFSVDFPTGRPGLPKLNVRTPGIGLHEGIDMLSAWDESVIATWQTSGVYYAGVLDWRSTDAEGEDIGCTNFTAWRLPQEFNGMASISPRHLRTLSADTFCIFCLRHISVFRLPPNHGSRAADSDIPMLKPLWFHSFDIEPFDVASEDRVTMQARPFPLDESDDGSIGIEFSIREASVMLHIPASGSGGNITMIRRQHPPAVTMHILPIFRILPTRFLAFTDQNVTRPREGGPVEIEGIDGPEDVYTEDVIEKTMQFTTWPFEDPLRALSKLRLGTDAEVPRKSNTSTDSASSPFAMSSLLITREVMFPLTVDHDEWTGLTLLHECSADGLEHSVMLWNLGKLRMENQALETI